mgnify:CR=1 FL=1
MDKNLHIAIEAAIEAGKEIIKIYEKDDFSVVSKSDNSPLTIADIESNKIITNHLSKTNVPILSEEGKHLSYEKRSLWSDLWIVDPIDGTKEFIKRNGEFTVNIAYIIDNKPVLGVIFAPVMGLLYFSSKGLGSFKAEIDKDSLDEFNIDILNSKSKRLPIFQNDSATFKIVASRSHMSDETLKLVEEKKKTYGDVSIVSIGSSLKFCIVAEGKADFYPRLAPTMEWDTAAGQIICEEAGFQVVDDKTKKSITYNRKNLKNNFFTVSKII